MRRIWIPEKEILQRYEGEISTVGFSETYLAALSDGTHNSFWALGGNPKIEPKELEQEVIDAYLSMFREFKDHALRFYKAVGKPISLKNQESGSVNLSYIVGLAHTYGASYSDSEDLSKLEALRAAVPKLEKAYFGNFIPVESPHILLNTVSARYNSSVVGCLGEAPKTIRLIRPVVHGPGRLSRKI